MNSGRRPLQPGRLGWFFVRWFAVLLFLKGTMANAVAVDTSTPISFFTNVASRLLAAQLQVDLNRIQVYPTNQYTPAVHRLLQVTANLLDAQNTNYYPTVFRPLFAADTNGGLFITGYLQVTQVSGTADPQLATPHEISTLVGASTIPICDASGPVNVYGIPWVIGAKQGLPNFNQLSVVSAVQVTRRLEVVRDTLDPATANYATNQMYILSVSNNLGAEFWNSYNAAYPRPVTVYINDTLATWLQNDLHAWSVVTNFNSMATVSSWPGSQWVGTPPNAVPVTNAFLVWNWGDVILSPMAYDFNTGLFDPNFTWQSTTPALPQLPPFTLSLTNQLQAFILDGSNVIDYVQLATSQTGGSLNQALLDPNYPSSVGIYYQWSTNTYGVSSVPYGVMNQIFVSGHPGIAPAAGGRWSATPTPMGLTTPDAEAAYFNGFFTPTFQYNGMTYFNTSLAMAAPYTPVRTVLVPFLLQANDPLVHYLASDMNARTGMLAIWSNGSSYANGAWTKTDSGVLPLPPHTPVGGRYQPWGQGRLMNHWANVDTNACNPAFRDPLVWGSDYWNFPTGQNWSLNWVGQVHRGTPWQTLYLKSSNILSATQTIGAATQPSGTNTWATWTGDTLPDAVSGQYVDAACSAPVTDWQTISLLAVLLNTNDLFQQFPVNNSDPHAWAAQLDSLIALTNFVPSPPRRY